MMDARAYLSTVGPASNTPDQIRALIDAGTDAFRLNFSHGTRDTHAESLRRIRSEASAAGRQIGILQDLSGPKIRIGALAAPIALAAGDSLVIEHGAFAGSSSRVSCSFEPLFTSVPAGARLLLDDGRIELEVTSVSAGRLETRVITGGVLESHKGINVPGTALRTSAVTEKDVADLAAGLALGVDMVAVSFVQSADDVRACVPSRRAACRGCRDHRQDRKAAGASRNSTKFSTNPTAVMVARGDLGIEIPLEAVPAAQKLVVLGARERGLQ